MGGISLRPRADTPSIPIVLHPGTVLGSLTDRVQDAPGREPSQVLRWLLPPLAASIVEWPTDILGWGSVCGLMQAA